MSDNDLSAADLLGNIAAQRRDYDRAVDLYGQSLAISRSIGDKRNVASNLNNLGRIAGERGEVERSRELLDEGLTIVRELGDKVSSNVAAQAKTPSSLLNTPPRWVPHHTRR